MTTKLSDRELRARARMGTREIMEKKNEKVGE